MQCVILAGGLATRLRPITETIPKSMVRICNKPFLEYQISLLKKNDINKLVLCVGYLGEQIEDYFGDGKKFDIKIKYSYEKKELLNTGGAVRNAFGLLEDCFFILYGDSYLKIDYNSVYKYFLQNNLYSLLLVYKNKNKWDKSNIVFKNGIIELYDKENITNEMDYIDYGLSLFSKKIIEEMPENIPYDLAWFYRDLSKQKRLAGLEVFERFYEIGSYKGIKEFENYIREEDNGRVL